MAVAGALHLSSPKAALLLVVLVSIVLHAEQFQNLLLGYLTMFGCTHAVYAHEIF